MRTTNRRGPTPAFLLALGLASCGLLLVLIVVPLYVQRRVLAPTDALVAGPVYGAGLYVVPAAAACLYCFFSMLYLADAARRRGGPETISALVRQLGRGRRGILGAAVALLYAVSAGYGASAYWYATTSGLAVSRGWPAGAKAYGWADVSRRFVMCQRYRRGRRVVFRVELRDGLRLDLADTQQVPFAEHFPQIADLTRGAATEIGDTRFCPAYIRAFVEGASVLKLRAE